MIATACRVDSHTVRVGVTWSAIPTTGGEIFINIGHLTAGPHIAWNQKGRSGTHTELFEMGTDIADVIVVNLYNAKDNPVSFVQREIGDPDGGNGIEEIGAC